MKGGIYIPNLQFNTSVLGLESHDIESLDTSIIDGTSHVYITLKKSNPECIYCRGRTISHGLKDRIIRHPLIIAFDGVIHWRARRYLCKDCSATFVENNPFSFSTFINSYPVITRILEHLRNLDLTIFRIAELNCVSTTTVQNYLDSFIVIPQPSLPPSIGIDELHSRSLSAKNSCYVCVLVDNEKRVPFEILDSRSKSSLNTFLSKYSDNEKSLVKYVTIDMWSPYKDVCLRHFKNAKIAVDPFHVVKHVCDAFSKLRVSIMNQATYGSDSYYLLKKWHRLLEKTDLNLDNEPKYNSHFKRHLNRRQLRDMDLSTSDLLLDAFNLKELFREFIRNGTEDNCREWLERLIAKFHEYDLPCYREFLNMITVWSEEIITSFIRPYDDKKLSNRLSENINGKIRSYMAISYGITNFKRFRKRVLFGLNPRISYAIHSNLKTLSTSSKKRGAYKYF